MRTFTLAAAFVATFLGTPSFAGDDSIDTSSLEVGICVSPTTFFARNFSGQEQVFLFQNGSTIAWRTLAPGYDMLWSFPQQQLAGMRVEVASWTDGYWQRSGAVTLTDVLDRGADAVWFQSGNPKPKWSSIGTTMLPEDGGPSIFPTTLPAPTSTGTGGEDLLMSTTHVPILHPDDPNGDVPPVLEDHPLPPL